MVKRKIIKEIDTRRFKEVSGEHKNLAETTQPDEFNQDDFETFFTSDLNGASPLMQAAELPRGGPVELENTAAGAPSTAPDKDEEVAYGGVVNAPEYGNVYEQISQEVENRRTDMQRDVTQARLVQREQDIRSAGFSPQEMNMGGWQSQNVESRDSSERDYVTKARRKKADDNLPFQ
ncbi:MAG: hypothetical protein ABIE22_02820 [archaeon]